MKRVIIALAAGLLGMFLLIGMSSGEPNPSPGKGKGGSANRGGGKANKGGGKAGKSGKGGARKAGKGGAGKGKGKGNGAKGGKGKGKGNGAKGGKGKGKGNGAKGGKGKGGAGKGKGNGGKGKGGAGKGKGDGGKGKGKGGAGKGKGKGGAGKGKGDSDVGKGKGKGGAGKGKGDGGKGKGKGGAGKGKGDGGKGKGKGKGGVGKGPSKLNQKQKNQRAKDLHDGWERKRDLARRPKGLGHRPGKGLGKYTVPRHPLDPGFKKDRNNIDKLAKEGHIPRHIADDVRDRRPILPRDRDKLRTGLDRLPYGRDSLSHVIDPGWRYRVNPGWFRNPADRRLADGLLARRPWTRADWDGLRGRYRAALRAGNWELARHYHHLWRGGRWFGWNAGFLGGFAPAFPVAGAFFPDALIPFDGGGGFVEGGWMPNVIEQPGGTGVGVAILPPVDGSPVGVGAVNAGELDQDVIDTDGLSDDLGVKQDTRFLRIYNATDGKLKVWVQYETKTDAGDWVWSPAAPGDPSQALSLEVNPGETVDLQDGDWRLNARRVRIWARSDTGEWNRFRETDLWLVPEEDHLYDAPEVQTFLFTVR
jgi:hypothetical protein